MLENYQVLMTINISQRTSHLLLTESILESAMSGGFLMCLQGLEL